MARRADSAPSRPTARAASGAQRSRQPRLGVPLTVVQHATKAPAPTSHLNGRTRYRHGGVRPDPKKVGIICQANGATAGDREAWTSSSKGFGNDIAQVRDDLFCSSGGRPRQRALSNLVPIKPGRIPAHMEALATVELRRRAGDGCLVSNRSADIEKALGAKLRAAVCAGSVETGGRCGRIRATKFSRLFRMQRESSDAAHCPGRALLVFSGRQP